jgi:CRP-like cAMP-binding protein
MLLTNNLILTTLPETHTEGRRLHFYERGEEIPLIDEGIWEVYRGIVQLSQLSSRGDEVCLGWVQPSHFFGLWFTQIDSYQAKALSELYLRWYSLSEIEKSPHLAPFILTQVVQQMRQRQALLGIVGLRRVEDRLRELLQLLKQEIGQLVEEGTRLPVRLTHQNLANAIGTTRVTVTKLLGEFQRQGWLSLDGERHIIIHS